MWYKRCLLLIMVLLIVSMAATAEWWMLPNKYFFEVGETARIGFAEGADFRPEPWLLSRDHVVKTELHTATTVIDLRANIKQEVRERLQIKFDQDDTYLLSLQSSPIFRAQDAPAFDAFLEENGLDEVIAHRKEPEAKQKNTEYYTVYTKLLVQVGRTTGEVYKKRLGFPLEIIPEKNPYMLKAGDRMRFKILKQGEPLFGARVKVWNRKDSRTTLQNIYTEKDGTIETQLSSAGPWMVSVVQIEPSKEEGAEWACTIGSIAFGIR